MCLHDANPADHGHGHRLHGTRSRGGGMHCHPCHRPRHVPGHIYVPTQTEHPINFVPSAPLKLPLIQPATVLDLDCFVLRSLRCTLVWSPTALVGGTTNYPRFWSRDDGSAYCVLFRNVPWRLGAQSNDGEDSHAPQKDHSAHGVHGMALVLAMVGTWRLLIPDGATRSPTGCIPHRTTLLHGGFGP